MSQWDSAANEAAAALPSIVQVTLVYLAIPGAPIYAHDGWGTLTWNGHDWTGVGLYGNVERVREGLEIIGQPLRLHLSGVPTELVSAAMETQYHRQQATLYIGLLDPVTGAWIDDPEVAWDGFMDVMTIDIDQGSAQITLDCENELMTAVAASRMTDEAQQALFAGDLGLEFLHSIPGFVGKWGQKNVYGGFPMFDAGGSPTTPTREIFRRAFNLDD